MKKTVLVLGAGASKDLGFPLGEELLTQIIEDMEMETFGNPLDPYHFVSDGVNKLFNTKILLKREFSGNKEMLKAEIQHFREFIIKSKTEFSSIDSLTEKYGETYPEKALRGEIIAKFLIAYRLQGWESTGLLNGKFGKDDSEKWKYWGMIFWEKFLSIPGGFEEHSKNLKVINFNYERAFEFSLFQSLWINNAHKSKNEAFEGQEFMTSNMVNVYGKMGHFLPPYSNLYTNNLPFGLPNNRTLQIFNSSGLIDLMRSARKSQEALWRKWFIDADQIFFLGFGFAADNMEILGWEEFMKDPTFSEKRILTTGNIEICEKFRVTTTNMYCKEFSEERLIFD